MLSGVVCTVHPSIPYPSSRRPQGVTRKPGDSTSTSAGDPTILDQPIDRELLEALNHESARQSPSTHLQRHSVHGRVAPLRRRWRTRILSTLPLMHYPTLIQDTSRREPAPTRDYPTICTISPKFRTPRDACASTNTGLSHYVHYPTQIQDTSRRLCQHPPGTTLVSHYMHYPTQIQDTFKSNTILPPTAYYLIRITV